MDGVFSGLSEAEAAIQACEALGLTRRELKYEVLPAEKDGRGVTIQVAADVVESAPGPGALVSRGPAHRSSEGGRGRDRGGRDRGGRDRGGRDRGGRDRGGRDRGGRDRDRGRGRDGGRRGRGDGDRGDRRRADEVRVEDHLPEETTGEQIELVALPEEGLGPRVTRALEHLREVVSLMDLDVQVCVVESADEGTACLNVHGPDQAAFIGERGEALLAMQFLLGRMLTAVEGDERIVLDAGDYRSRRRASLAGLAEELGQKAIDRGQPITLAPMNAHDRRIFHLTLAETEGVSTRSEGDGLLRRVIISPEMS